MTEKYQNKWIDEINEAHKAISKICVKTDVRNLSWLKRIAGIDAVGKFENQQKTGSFKFRGAYNRLRRNDHLRNIIVASAGNHGLAIAEAAKILGLNATICIPTTASPLKRNRLAAYGYSIVPIGTQLEESTIYAKNVAEKNNWDFISPYNDSQIIQGQASVALEFLEQVPDIDVLIVPVGGGGLISGVGLIAKQIKPGIKIIGVEAESYSSVASSLKAGKIKKVINYPTFADGLAVNLEDRSITFDIIKQIADDIILVNEEEIAAAVLALLYHESQLVEPSGAVGLAAVISGKIRTGAKIGIIFSGGNITTGNLTKIMNFPFQDKNLFDFINIHGEKILHKVPLKGIDFSLQGYKQRGFLSENQELDAREDIEYLTTRFDEIKQIVHRIQNRLKEYLDYCNVEKLNVDESAVYTITNLERNITELLEQNKVINLNSNLSPVEYGRQVTSKLQAYRSLLHMVMVSSMVLDWRSASYGQSWDTMFFALDSQGNPGVNYNRYESNQLISVERQLAEVLGLNQEEIGLLVTSSGMAAYNIIEAYLQRHVLKPGDTVLIPQYIYFETDEQISKLPNINIKRANTHDINEICNLIKKNKPKVVFLDPLTNTVELRLTDVGAVIKHISKENLKNDIYFVVDGTMMSGEINPFPASGANSRVKVLYYDSCSKYLQLGLDIAMGGLVAIPVEFTALFDRLRRNTGTIMYDSASNIFPTYSREIHSKRMRRMSRNAILISNAINRDNELSRVVRVHYPNLKSHPDYALAERFNSVGGLVTFTFTDPFLNQRDSLNSFIETALSVAKKYGISLTKGVSFGFSLPRISAATAMAENSPPFLRLSAGDRSYNETTLLADALIEAFRNYIHSFDSLNDCNSETSSS
ncbi:MAG: pyridoxal-phosphate dependent enzyme [Patescibacteria group bacterium]|nr:pyridoxal-phosphate dependent enzyme [Patescibacteria group bacterium]